MRNTPLKRGRPKARPSLQAFHEVVTRNPCALGPEGCYGRLWGHHYIEQRVIRSEYATRMWRAGAWEADVEQTAERDRALLDPRNGVSLCIAHHDAVTNGRVVCPRPEGLDEFEAEFGIYERRAA